MNQTCCITNAGSVPGEPLETDQTDIRVDKILEIRRQLGEGTYSIADRLDVVVEKIIREIS